ncbi:hypothetical protein Daus18300_013471 [Diaporthe australafricana]|uniref:Uncharacterized protein n=1 Tax=Diaporthe australafricana TaxID=127596 RepID=A0ABR3VYV2_9PEZI
MKWTQQVHKPILWRCDVDHAAEIFQDEDAFKDHLNVEHGEYTPTQQEAIHMSSIITKRRRRNICPLCNVDVATKMTGIRRPGKTDEYEQLHNLAKHIAGHLRRLAFDSVENLDAEFDDVSNTSMSTGRGKIRRAGSEGRPPSGVEHMSSVKLDRPERPAMFLWRIVLAKVINELRFVHPELLIRKLAPTPGVRLLLQAVEQILPHRHFELKTDGYELDVDWPNPTTSFVSSPDLGFMRIINNPFLDETEGKEPPWSDTLAILKERMDPEIRQELESSKRNHKPHLVLQSFLLQRLIDTTGKEDAERFWSFTKAYIGFQFPHASEAVADVLLRAALFRRARLLRQSKAADTASQTSRRDEGLMHVLLVLSTSVIVIAGEKLACSVTST